MQRFLLLFFAAWLVAFAPVVRAADAEPAEPDAEIFIPIAEEVLDTAIAHCKRGDLAQAQALFAAVLEQLDPPPAIRTLIMKLQTQGCQIQQTLPRRWELRALVGHDDNVSQGIRNSSFSAGPSVARIELPIDDNYRPIPSTFAELTAAHQWVLPQGANLQLKTGGRRYASARAYDLAFVNASLKTQLNALGRPVEIMGEWAELWLGGRHYHSALTAAAQAPLVPGSPQWNLAAVAQTVRYHTQPQQNAEQFQGGITRQIKAGPNAAALVGVMGVWDHAKGQRAGGDRSGINVYVASEVRVAPWRLGGRVGVTQWATRQDFLPGLIDEKRRNKLLSASVQAEYPLAPGQTLQLEMQLRSSNDTITLYAYRSVSWGISWNAKF